MLFSKICLVIAVILLILPFACKWYLTKYLPAWSDLFELLRSVGKHK